MGDLTHQITALKQSTTVIDGIVDSSISPGILAAILAADSQPYPHLVMIGEQKPQATFTGIKIGSLITQFGIDGQAINATPLELYTLDTATGGSRGSGGEKISVVKGLIVPTTLSASQGNAPATLSYLIAAGGTDADAAPMSVTSDQTAPALTSDDEAFFLGAVTLNSADIGPVDSVNIDFGFNVVQRGGSGDQYPSIVY